MLEFRTPAGYYIVVNEEDLACGVFRGEVGNITLELLHATGLHVAAVAFLGHDVRPGVNAEGFSLLPVRSGSLSVPYAVADGSGRFSEKRGIQVSVRIAADQFPVLIHHFPDARAFLRDLSPQDKKIYRLVMMGGAVPRIDVMGVRVALPRARIFQTRTGPEGPPQPARSTVRAADLLEQPGADFVARNPVYMARVLLRRLDFIGMERLPMDFDLNAQDLEFIRTFIDIMLKNENNIEELTVQRARLQELAAFFHLVDLVLRGDQAGLEKALGEGVPESMPQRLLPFLQKERKKALSREEEIVLWEMEYRIVGRGGN